MYRGHRVLENLRTLPANIRSVPKGWKQYVRMDGDLYWHNPELKLTTYDDIRDRELLAEVVEIAEEHMRWCDDDGFVFPYGTETFIGMVKEDAGIVQHVSLSSGIFFSIGDELNIRYEAKQSFWNYFSQYCMHVLRLPPKVEVEFLSAMTFGANEWILGYRDTTFPFNERQCERIMEIYQVLRRLHQKEAGDGYISLMLWLISETMLVIESRRTTQEYSSAKMWTSKSINIPKPSRKLQALDYVLGFLLFGTQITFRQRLQQALANRSESISHLREFMDTLLVQWSDSNLLATVMVLANVSLNALKLSAVQRTASLVSIIFALTSMIIGLHQVWQHRMHLDADIDEQWKYLGKGDVGPDTDARLTAIACCLVLPIASLMWCMLTFTVALGAICFQNTESFGEHVLFAAILSVLGSCACGTSLYFWSMSRRIKVASRDTDLGDVTNALEWVRAMAKKGST